MGGRGRRFLEASLIETDLRKRVGREEGAQQLEVMSKEGRNLSKASLCLGTHTHVHRSHSKDKVSVFGFGLLRHGFLFVALAAIKLAL